MKHIILLFLFIFLIFGCVTNTQETFYGAKITSENISDFAEVKNNVNQQGKIYTKIKGRIVNTCPKKGCWMNLGLETDTIFVKFKDYKFFVPKDTTVDGKIAIIEGNAFLDTLSVAELQHYAEDDGKSLEEIEAITSPQYQILFLADGVIIQK